MTAIEHDVPSDLLDIADLGADGVRKSLDLASLNPRELGAPLAGGQDNTMNQFEDVDTIKKKVKTVTNGLSNGHGHAVRQGGH